MPTLTEILKAIKKPTQKAQLGQILDPLSLNNKTFRTNIGDLVGNSGSVNQNNKMNSLVPGPVQPKTRVPGQGLDKQPGGASGLIGGVAALGSEAIDIFSKGPQANTWGIEKQNNSANTGKSVLSGAASGAAAGAALGPWGAAIGGVAGGLMGFFKGKKKAKTDDKTYKDTTQMAYEDYNQKAEAQQYAAMGKAGAKLAIMKKIKGSKTNAISFKDRKFKSGGKLDKVGEINVIPSGTLHKEKNNLGEKDKGLPIVDENGNKQFEVEREELILRLSATKEVEGRVESFKKTHNVRHLIDLGKFLTKEIMTNTHDNSGKFGLEAK